MTKRRIPAAERRTQILEVARAAFARDGYRGATALEIGRQAGVSETLVLKHFGTKESLFRAAVVNPLLELLETQTEITRQRFQEGNVGTPNTGYDETRSFLGAWALLVKEEGPLALSLLAELRDFPDVGDRLAHLLERHVDALAGEVGLAARRRPSYRDFDARVATYAALAAATVAAVTTDDPAPFLDQFVEMLFLGVLSDRGRAELLGEEHGRRSARGR